MSETAMTKHHTSWGCWKAGEGLWWRNDEGVHAVVLTAEPEYGPRGARRKPGRMTEFSGHSMAAVNRSLAELGFGPSRLKVSDIKWHPDPGVRAPKRQKPPGRPKPWWY